MTDSFTKKLRDGWAEFLADADIGLTWNASGRYDSDQIAIVIADMPQEPDRVVSLSVTPMRADPTQAVSAFNMQFLSRGRAWDGTIGGPDEPVAVDDSIQKLLLGRMSLTLSTGIDVSVLECIGGGSGGKDDIERHLWASRWQFNAYRPNDYRH